MRVNAKFIWWWDLGLVITMHNLQLITYVSAIVFREEISCFYNYVVFALRGCFDRL
jgi:hypothetical protein